jgi:hypothetical protein
MVRNLAGQSFTVFAFDLATGAPVTDDAANITAEISKDGGTLAAVDDTNPTEIKNGFYRFDATQSETDANKIEIFPVSSTSGVQVILVGGVIYPQRAVPAKGMKVTHRREDLGEEVEYRIPEVEPY